MINDQAILLVEDNDDDIFQTKKALVEAGTKHSIHIVRDGNAALDYLSGTEPFNDRTKHPLPVLILLDLTLPSKHGMEVLQRIRSQDAFKHIIVIVLTVSDAHADVPKAYRLGANSFLRKPLTAEKILETA